MKTYIEIEIEIMTDDDIPEVFKNDTAICSYWDGEKLTQYEWENK